MALVLADRVKETTSSTGTGTIGLLGAATGYQSFAAVGNANTTYYCIASQTVSEWEVGIGTYTASGTTLSRDTVLSSSNGGSLVSFSTGTKDVFVTYPSGRSVYANGTVLTATNSSILPVTSGGTGVTTSTGTGNTVLSTSPTLVTPILGTPTSVTLTNATGLPISTGVSGLGTGVATALAVNVGTAGAPVVNGGVLGTPSSGTVTNLTGTASININGTVGATTPATAAVTTLTASADSTFSSTGALLISKGTTAQRTAGTAGQLRFNTTTTEFEGYNGTAWASVGGAALANDTSTASNLFPLFASATTGTASTLNTSNAKLLYKPSTGEFQASVPVASNGIFVNSTTVGTSYTIAAGYNGQSVGPVTISSGVAITVATGQRWLVL